MGNFEIIQRNGNRINLQSREPFCAVKSATQNTSLMGDDNVQISFVSSEFYTFGKGDRIIVGSEEYTIRTKVQREMISEGYYQYEATFYGVMYELMKSLYRNAGEDGKSTTSTFDLTYSIRDFVKVLIYNVSRDYPGLWVFDEDNCPDTEPRTISFSKQNCLQVLQSLCSENEFGLEFQITQENGVRTIHIGKFGSKVNPPSGSEYFEWGKGNGLYKLKEQKVDDKTIITRLWVEGGSTNIKSGYRDYSERLQLPYPRRVNKNEHKLADGTVIKAGSEYIGIDDDSKRYLEDAELRDALGSDEDAVTFDEIYPKRTGEVTAVGADINSFVDGTMDFDLCEKDDNGTKYLIDGVAAKITFISGKLAGQQFELAEKGGYDHGTKTFKLIPFTDNRGLTIPTTDTEAFRIAVGDRYKLTDINMPDSYVANAEEELWYAGMDEFTPRTQARAQYELTFDRSYFLANLPSDSEATIFHVGDYLPVKDDRFGIEKTIRIQKVTRNLLAEHDYSLTLSDIVAVSIISQTVVDVKEHERVIESNQLRNVAKMRRGWRTTEELRNMVYDTDGYFDGENIRPNSIDTNMLTVGSKSQQFVLADVVLQANVNGLPNRFNASAGALLHLTIDEKAVKRWNLSAAEFTMANNKGYYLFAKCSKKGNTGIWYLTQEQLKVEPTEDPNNYYFQVGIVGSLNSDDNFRDFVTTYGFTRINGNTITTGKIVTSDKQSYLDLDGNKFRIGDSTSSIDYNVTKKGQVTFHNVQLLSDSGDTSDIGVFRGTYNPDYVYYKGDEVSYTVKEETCTYRYINSTPSMGNLPTNTAYWAVVAKGSQGEQGLSLFYTYNDSHDTPATPTGEGTTGGWHTDSTNAVIWMSIKQAKSVKEGTWGTPFRVRGADGTSINIKGSVTDISKLPTTGNTNGDAYLLGNYLYVWDGTNWNNVGQFKGEDGKSSYLHKKYSDDGGKTFTAGNGETPGRWLGLYTDQSPTDSDSPASYKWQDTKGDPGTPGLPGEDGRTTYLHIKYSDNGGLSFTGNNGEDAGAWIGQYTDYEELDSNDPSMYTWARIRGESGTAGADAEAGVYYEYRYSKNGSMTEPNELDVTDPDPSGWTTAMPSVGKLEYLWCTIAKKSTLVDKTKFNLPVNASDGSYIRDTSGNGYTGSVGSGSSVIQDGSRYALKITGQGESVIPYDLPFGESFTLCLWMKSELNAIKWMLNGYNGREYVENELPIPSNTWFHLALRFNDRTVTIFLNGEQLQSGSVNEKVVGFAMYDNLMFGSTAYYDNIRLINSALPITDIVSVMNGTADRLVENWSTPIRINPYDGKDGKSVVLTDVEYAISESSTTAPTTGWQTTAPTWEDGKYIWSRTRVDYSDKTSTYTKAACITGGKGATGSAGVGIKSIVEEYYLSTSATSLLNGSWSTTRPEWTDKWYIWTRSKITYTNDTVTTTDAICVTGSKGDTGAAGSDGANLNYNLFKQSNFFLTWNWFGTFTVVDGGYNGNKALYRKFAAVGSTTYNDLGYQYIKLLKGHTYTISAYVKGSGSKVMMIIYKENVLYKEYSFNSPSDWQRMSYTFTVTTDDAYYYCGFFRIMAGECYISCPKLEEGEHASDWCLSQEEMTGSSVIAADSYARSYTKAQWDSYGANGHIENWYSINNVASYRYGDIILIRGICSDRDGASVMLYATVVSVDKANLKVTAKSIVVMYGGEKGDKGDKGDSPALVYRGIYSSSATYYGTSSRVDAVKYNGVYYVARVDAGSFSGKVPTNTSYWNTFGAQFESIATGLLLADMANIANLIFKDGKLISQDGTVNGVDSSDYSNADFVPNIIIDGTTGIITTSNGLKIDKSGVTLYNSTNDDKEVVLKITSDSIGTEVDLSKKSESSVTKSISKPSNSIYMPTTSSSITSGIAEVYDIGYLSEKSTITISSGNMKCTLPGHSNSSGSVTYSTVKLEIRLLRNGAAVKSWSNNIGGSAGTTINPSLSPSYTVTIDNETYKEGRYQISIGLYFTLKANGVSGNTANFSVTGSLVYGYAKKGFEKTLMGKDGLYSCWGENKYFLCSANGIKMRQGNYLLQITSSGMKKSTNGGSSWTDL